MLGVKPEDRDKLLRWSDELLGGGEAAELPDEQRRAHAAGVFLEYVDYAKQVLFHAANISPATVQLR